MRRLVRLVPVGAGVLATTFGTSAAAVRSERGTAPAGGMPVLFWIGLALLVLAVVALVGWWWSGRAASRTPSRPDRSSVSGTSAPTPGWSAAGPPPRVPPGVPVGPTAPVPVAPRAAPAAVGEPAAEDPDRAHLVRLCIDVADRLRNEHPALNSRLHRGLAEVGVVAVQPDGEPFDRRHHDAVDSEPTAVSERDRTVASTELLGYLDRGGVLRRPEVVVFSWKGPSDEH